jgi:hypothetical protein
MNRLFVACGVFGLSGAGNFAAMVLDQSTASAQTGVTSGAVPTSNGSERKVRVVLPSPYQHTDKRPKSAKPIKPTAGAPKPTTAPDDDASAPATHAVVFGPPIQPSTFIAPRVPQERSKPAKSIEVQAGPLGVPQGGKHDLNVASLADLNSLQGGGLIGRAIIAGRPYRSVDELVTRRILSRATYNWIKGQVQINPEILNP